MDLEVEYSTEVLPDQRRKFLHVDIWNAEKYTDAHLRLSIYKRLCFGI